MTDPVQQSILEAVGRLDQAGANRFLGSLLAAEVSLQRQPIENFSYARDEHEKDGGVDGHLELPIPQTSPFPEGRTKWQFKSGSVKPTAKRDVGGKSKEYLRDQIRDGADFVLAWTQSPPDKVQQSQRKEFTAAVKSVRSDARTYCFFGVQLAEMALRHPGVVADFGLSVFGSLLTIEDWERHLPGSQVSFLPDQPRTDLMSRLRVWADSVEAPHSLYVFGSAGVGKSRTVLEAFKPPGLSERVLYAPTPDSISPSFWQWILGHKQSRLCLVVDECSIERLSELQGYANAAGGRLRLVALGDRGPNRGLLGGGEFIELQPVAASEMEKALRDAFGLSSEKATFVANLAQGYPGLAWSIVQVLPVDPTLDVTKLSRSGSVSVLLNRMLPVAEHREFLGILALFSNVGFDGDVSGETDAICSVFNADVGRFRQVVGEERDLVGVTGRYRHVTPVLFAIWVASERLAAFQDDLRERLDQLPEVLFLRFQEQLENFGPNEHAKVVVRGLLEERAGPLALSELASYGRLLRAAAAVDRELVMGIIERSVAQNRSQLLSLASRLDLGWTLEYLAWWPDTFHSALRILFLLALEKVPGYSDQSTRHLTALFQLHLGGTSVAFSQRLDALQEIVEAENSDAARSLGVECLGSALISHEVRTATTIHGGTALPEEWRPTALEVLPLREQAFTLLLDWALAVSDEATRESILLKIAGELPMLLYVLPGQAVLPKLEKVDWPPKGRAKLAQGLHMVLAHDTLDPEYASALRALAAKLRGQTFDSLVGFVFSASPWELAEGREEQLGTPEVVKQLGDQLGTDSKKLDAALALAQTGDPLSVGKVFERLAEVTSDRDETYARIVAKRPVVWAAIVGYLIGRDRSGDAHWVTQALRELTEDDGLIGAFPIALAGTDATDERASIALASLRNGRLQGRDLIRLKFGLWVLGLGEEVAMGVIDALATDDDANAQEAALALLDQYSEERPESKDRLRDLAARVLTAERKSTPMSSHYRRQLTARFAFDHETRLQILLQAIEEDSPHVMIETDADLFDQLIKEQPTKTVKILVDRLVADVKAHGWSRWAFSLEEFHFLSRAVGIGGKKPVAMALRGLSQENLAMLLPHFNYEGLLPDPLLVEIIESGSEDLRRVATGQFFHSPNGWMGSRIPILERRRSEAEAWSKVGGPAFKRWASSLVPLYDRAIPAEVQNEAEFDAAIR